MTQPHISEIASGHQHLIQVRRVGKHCDSSQACERALEPVLGMRRDLNQSRERAIRASTVRGHCSMARPNHS